MQYDDHEIYDVHLVSAQVFDWTGLDRLSKKFFSVDPDTTLFLYNSYVCLTISLKVADNKNR